LADRVLIASRRTLAEIRLAVEPAAAALAAERRTLADLDRLDACVTG
jgi:DNA-binding FadR family transcriptional regulator